MHFSIFICRVIHVLKVAIHPRRHHRLCSDSVNKSSFSLNTMDSNINESCKEASHEGVTMKFVRLKDVNHGKRLDPVWSYFLRSAESKYNRYIALCTYCMCQYCRIDQLARHSGVPPSKRSARHPSVNATTSARVISTYSHSHRLIVLLATRLSSSFVVFLVVQVS